MREIRILKKEISAPTILQNTKLLVAQCSANVWKYHMAGHYEQSHAQLAIPEAFVVCNAEKEAISVNDK